MDVKKLYGEWLEERRKADKPPLTSDAHIYIAAFIEWIEKQRFSNVTIEDIIFATKKQLTEDEVSQVFALHIRRFWNQEQKERFCRNFVYVAEGCCEHGFNGICKECDAMQTPPEKGASTISQPES